MVQEKKQPDFMKPGIGNKFQEETKYTPERIGGYTLDWEAFPDQFKNYESPLAVIALPQPEFTGDPDLWKALYRRRSRRVYRPEESLPLVALSALLWATQGITEKHGDSLFRAAPSAGGLFPVETYLNVRLVEGLETGIYHFRPGRFDLEFLKRGEFSRPLAAAALGQGIVATAQVTFVWSAALPRSKWKYRQRAYRYIYLDAGHICQNLYLAGEALGLGICAIGAFFDDHVNDIIGIDGNEETAIYMATVGKIFEGK
ncbi:MAG: nitroreductase [Deltaproteobacteria bacterium]|nr:nitroreductase [Deltaproteobacteria bacterium]